MSILSNTAPTGLLEACQYLSGALALTDSQLAGSHALITTPASCGISSPPSAHYLPACDAFTWLTLQESATQSDTHHVSLGIQSALTQLHTSGSTFIVTIGSTTPGTHDLKIGFPTPTAAQIWQSACATNSIWAPSTPPNQLSAPTTFPLEIPLFICPQPAVSLRTELPTESSLERLLRNAAMLQKPWILTLYGQPVPENELLTVTDTVVDAIDRISPTLNRNLTISESESAHIENLRAKRLLDTFTAWFECLERGHRSGSWAITTALHTSDATNAAVLLGAVKQLGNEGSLRDVDSFSLKWHEIPLDQQAPPATTWLGSDVLSGLLQPPRNSIGTIRVREQLPGARQTLPAPAPITMGTWTGTQSAATFDVSDFAAHALITGTTGSGKSTTTRKLLTELWNEHQIPFLVIDPAKSDYKELGPFLHGGLRVVDAEQLSMNILQAWPGQPKDRHTIAVGTALRGAFEMPPPVPYVAMILFDRLAERGLQSPITLHAALAELDVLISDLGYSGDIESNIRASLGLRLRLLLQPRRAQRVAGRGVPTWLTEGPTVVQLNSLADEEERTFIAALLVLYVADAARRRGESASLQHVVVLEEAHRLMPATTSANESNATSVSTQLMTQLLAEVRSYGQALFVVDQSPAAISREAIRNTNVKLAHRVVDATDQETMGGAMGLTVDQSPMLGSLPPGRTIVAARRLSQPQSVTVSAHQEPSTSGGVATLAPPDGANCHPAEANHRHHYAVQIGKDCELGVSLWVSSQGAYSITQHFKQLAAKHPAAGRACMVSVGIERYTDTLIRVKQLKLAQAQGFKSALLQAVQNQQPPPQQPAPPKELPFATCQYCPAVCKARPVLHARLVELVSYAETEAKTAPTLQRRLDVVKTTISGVKKLFSALPNAYSLAFCAGAHVADAAGVGLALKQIYRDQAEKQAAQQESKHQNIVLDEHLRVGHE